MMGWAIVASGLYAMAMGWLWHRAGYQRWRDQIWGLLGLCVHGEFLHRLIDTPEGQVLEQARMVSLLLWLALGVVWVLGFWRPLITTRIILYAACIASLGVLVGFPHAWPARDVRDPIELLHVFSSFLGMALLVVGMLHAFSLGLQNRTIKKRREYREFPDATPLELQEKWLFQTVITAFLVLSLGLLAGFWYDPDTRGHAVWGAVGAWALCAGLVYGRHRYGWRSRVTGPVALVSNALLFFAYFRHFP